MLKGNKLIAAKWNILCDFDGTIASVDVIDVLLEQFADPIWQVIEQQWKSGSIGSLECLSKQIKLLKASYTQLDEYLDTITIDPDFPAFVTQAESKGCNITILSDGLDYAIKRILSRYGLGYLPVIANVLEQKKSQQWQLTFSNTKQNCEIQAGHCKCASLQRIHNNAPDTYSLLIGDGTSDFCIAKKVDFVLAKKQLIDHCISHDLPHYAIQGFSDALTIL